MIKKAAEYIRIPKKLFYGVLIVAVVGGVLWSIKPSYIPVDLGSVQTGEFKQVIIDEGVTYFKERHMISAPADGITPKLSLEAGDPVKKGQVLIEFFWDTNFKVKSPVDGYVLRVFEKDKRHITRGTPILEVGDPESLEIQSMLLSEEVIRVKEGQKALITNWGKDEPLEAEVSRIEPAAKEEVSALGVKEKRVKVHMDITSPKEKWKGLGDGFRVEVSVVTDEVPEARLLPVGALFSNDGEPAVYVFKNNKLHLTPVKIGAQNRDFAQLETDLPEGTQVVLYPGGALEDQQKAKVRK